MDQNIAENWWSHVVLANGLLGPDFSEGVADVVTFGDFYMF